ncbi:MAG: MBL fold metallo-hydrolase [Burkholderiales bacterium]|nr:MBL fold metallo-hydrolase [Burkholderiales bacterium]
MSMKAVDGATIFERGWLSSNNVLLHGDGAGAVLVDSGHGRHAAQTLALVQHALRGEALAGIVNTHLHSDHCGGNAALVRAQGSRITVPPGQWDAVRVWDEEALSYAPTGQECERFSADARLAPGQAITVGRQRWLALAAPGHDPHSLILYNDVQGVVITADALWERGFGVVFPELDGESAFDDVAAVLDLIESLGARLAIPGHGAPFEDIAGALAAARSRLDGFRREPARHSRHALKVLVKFHLLERQRETLAQTMAWFASAGLYRRVWDRLGRPAGSLDAYAQQLLAEMAAAGHLALVDGEVRNV